jgi:hypothetical protein
MWSTSTSLARVCRVVGHEPVGVMSERIGNADYREGARKAGREASDLDMTIEVKVSFDTHRERAMARYS